jgi:hypothetical protein
MFDSIEIRTVQNGVIVVLRTEDEDKEYVYDTDRKAIKFIKDLLDLKAKDKTQES